MTVAQAYQICDDSSPPPPRRAVVDQKSPSQIGLKSRCIFLMYFMSNGFQTVYYFYKELHLGSHRVPRTSFNSFSQKFQVLIDLLYHLSI